LCSKGQPVADAAGVLQVQLHGFSPTNFPAAPQTPLRAGVAQAPAASTNTAGHTAAAAGPSRGTVDLLKPFAGYELLSVVAVLADGVPVPAANGATDTTLVSILGTSTSSSSSMQWLQPLTVWYACSHAQPPV
jgi:hypothetical protein